MTAPDSKPLQDTITGMKAAEYAAKFARVHEPSTRRLRPIQLIPLQRRFVDGFDEVDPLTGLPRYPELLISGIKKTGKDTVLSICGNSSLIARPV